ncbi:MAG: serine/threonine-protein kinase [Rivularia sp. (in: cyanobacteria)]
MNAGSLISNRYRVEKFLGQGGFGRTYLVSDMQRFGEACVLKEFLPTNTEEDFMRKLYKSFEREARVLHSIDHPQIPKFIAWFKEEDKLFIVQEYIEGKTYSQILLERLSQTGKVFSEAEVTQWLWDMIPVLEYIHKHNLIHRDISLDNVMLSANQLKPILINFGLVKDKVGKVLSANNPEETVMGILPTKLGYAPLEQIRKGEFYPCSDIYTLGVCAVRLLTGKDPSLLLDNNYHLQWRSHVQISDDLACILDKMLAEKPTERYQSANEILTELGFPNTYDKVTAINSSKAKIEINIDQQKRNYEVAEILESNDFKLANQLKSKLNNKVEASRISPLELESYSNQSVGRELLLDDNFEETSLKESKLKLFDLKFKILTEASSLYTKLTRIPKFLIVSVIIQSIVICTLFFYCESDKSRESENYGLLLKELKSVSLDLVLPSQLPSESNTNGIVG